MLPARALLESPPHLRLFASDSDRADAARPPRGGTQPTIPGHNCVQGASLPPPPHDLAWARDTLLNPAASSHLLSPQGSSGGGRAGFGTLGHWRLPPRGPALGARCRPPSRADIGRALRTGGPSPRPLFSSPIAGEGLPRGVRLHLRLPASRAEPLGLAGR